MRKPLALVLLTWSAAICLQTNAAIADESDAKQTPDSQITICFRCDDWRAFGEAPDLDLREVAVCRRIIALFREKQIPLTIGVIPNFEEKMKLTPADSSASMLRELMADPLFEIALHGNTHLRVSPSSEWLGVPPAIQEARLDEALGMMEAAVPGLQLQTFVPPWNSFDLATVTALGQRGFTFLSGDAGIVRKRPFARWSSLDRGYHGLAIVPCTTSMTELPAVLERTREDPPGTIIVVILHPYNFYALDGAADKGESRDPWLKLTRALDLAASSGFVNCSTIGDLDRGALTADRYDAACRYHIVLSLLERVLPGTWLTSLGLKDPEGGNWLDNGRYLGEPLYRARLRGAALTLVLLILLPAAPLAFVAGRILRRRVPIRVMTLIVGILAIVVALGLERIDEFLSAPIQGGLRMVAWTTALALYLVLIVAMRPGTGRGTMPADGTG